MILNAAVVVFHHFFQGVEPSVVHIGGGKRNVFQGRNLKGAHKRRIIDGLKNAQAIVGGSVVRVDERFGGMAPNATAAAQRDGTEKEPLW